MLKLSENAMILAWVEFSLFLCLEKLEFKEQLHKLIITFDICLQVKVQKCLYALEALSVLAHGSIMDGIPLLWFILLREYLSHAHEKVTCVLFEERLHPDIELLVSLDCVCIVEDSRHQVPVLDVHVLESVALLLTVQLIKECFLQVNAFNVEDLD